MQEVKVPKFTENMQEATIVRWFKREGDDVRMGEPIVEVLGEKLTYELESASSGTLLKILFPDGSVVPPLKTIGFIGQVGEAIPQVETPEAETRANEHATAEQAPAKGTEVRIRISPLARKLAKEHGVTIDEVKGTGPGGRITREDIVRHTEETKARAVVREGRPMRVARTLPLVGVRRTIAERMTQSYRTAPHLTIAMDVDVTELVEHRNRILKARKHADARVTYTHMIVKAVASALRSFPSMNSSLEGDAITIFEDANVGLAVAVDDGLVVPVIHNADLKSVFEIARLAEELINKARDNKLLPDEVAGGTFTITNLGMFGVGFFTPIINPPQTAILGVGNVSDKPVSMNRQIVTRSVMTLSLTFDHRVVDGVMAAKFLGAIKRLLESPQELVPVPEGREP